MGAPEIAALCLLGTVVAIIGYVIYRSVRHEVAEYLLADSGICTISDGAHCYLDVVVGKEIVMKKTPMPAVSVDVRRDGMTHTSARLEGRGHIFDGTIESAVILVPTPEDVAPWERKLADIRDEHARKT